MSTDKVPYPSFTVSRKALMPLLKQIIRGCAKGSGALLNTCVLLDARPAADGKPASLTMAATDLIVSVRGKIGLMTCTAEGVFAIPGSRLNEVVGAMRGGDEIKFEPLVKADTVTVQVSTGKSSRVEFPYIDPSGFPHIYTSVADKVVRHKVPSGDLERALKSVRHASIADTVSNFHGVFLSAAPQAACAFSEQASAMFTVTLPAGLLSPAGVLLPLSTVDTILGICEAAPEVEIGIKARENGTPIRVYLRDTSSEIAVMLPSNVFPPLLPGQIVERCSGAGWVWHKMRRDEAQAACKLLLTMLSGTKGDPCAAVRFDAGVMRMQTHGDAGTCDQEVITSTAADHVFTAQPDGEDLPEPQRDCGMSINHLIAHLSTPALQAAEEFEIGVTSQLMGLQYVRPCGTGARYIGIMQPLSL